MALIYSTNSFRALVYIDSWHLTFGIKCYTIQGTSFILNSAFWNDEIFPHNQCNAVIHVMFARMYCSRQHVCCDLWCAENTFRERFGRTLYVNIRGIKYMCQYCSGCFSRKGSINLLPYLLVHYYLYCAWSYASNIH